MITETHSLSKIYKNVDTHYNPPVLSKARVRILYPRALFKIDKSHDIVPVHASYIISCSESFNIEYLPSMACLTQKEMVKILHFSLTKPFSVPLST